MRIRSTLFFLALAVVAPLAVFCAVAAWLLIDQENESLASASLARTRATLAAVDTKIRGSLDALNALSASRALQRGDLAAFQEDAQAVLKSQTGWQNIVMQRPDGAQLVNARLPWGSPLLQELVEVASFKTAVESGRPAIAGVSFAPKLNAEPGVSVRLPLIRDGVVQYVLTAVLSPTSFQEILVEQKLPKGWVSGLVGADGRVIARVPAVPAGTSASKDYLLHVGQSDEGWYHGQTIEGMDSYTAFSRSSLTGWTIGFAMPSNALFGGIRRAGATVFAGLIGSFLLAATIAIWYARRISHPLSQLASDARNLAEGEEPAPLRTSVSEVAEVSQALYATSQTLRRRDEELQRVHDELRGQAIALQRADDNKSHFLALLAHELRNPLVPVRAGLDLLARNLDQARQRDIRSMMERQIQNLARLIEDLVDVSRIDRGQLELRRETVKLEKIVRGAVEVANPGMEAKRQELSIHFTAKPLFVNGDPLRLVQVISNLLNNASKYTPQGKPIELSIKQDEDVALVTVKDSGVGFLSEDADRIFQVFVRLDETREQHTSGLGLGLTIARALAREHGGDVIAHSDGRGTGSTFTLRIPLDETGVDQLTTAPPASPHTPHTRRVLVADDNVDAADSTAELLAMEGFTVRCAYNGVEAVEVALEFRPEVAFLDLGMPGMSGLAVAKKLREELGTAIRLAAITGIGAPQDVEDTKAAGFDAHLKKPAELQALIRFASGAVDNGY